ncbi:MAG: hypothetical protein AAFP19_23830 [Bacteroidota bacterium]
MKAIKTEGPQSFLSQLPADEQEKLSLCYYLAVAAKPSQRRMASSPFYRTEVFACGPFYKPISKMLDDITPEEHA